VTNKPEPTHSYVRNVSDETVRALGELRRQNERLRLQAAAFEAERDRLQQEKLRLHDQLITTREELSARQEEHRALLRRLSDAEVENDRVAARFIDIEVQNTNLANLYVASHQLRSSVVRADVLTAIKEIIVNLIGSEDFSIFEKREGENKMVLIDAFVTPSGPMVEVPMGEGIIGGAAQSGQMYIVGDQSVPLAGLTACIPLKAHGEVIGLVVVFGLLPQKSNMIQQLDRELFDLISHQAGMALYCTRLHEAWMRSRRPIAAVQAVS
jgi:GAF domain-containing protein